VENEKMNGGESRPLLEDSGKVYAGERTEEHVTPAVEHEDASNDTSSTAPLPESTKIDDVERNTANNDGGLKIDFKYIDGMESKDPSLEDVRGSATGDMGTDQNIDTVTTQTADE
jgi:hypothetical protein